jgi:signal peptidase II
MRIPRPRDNSWFWVAALSGLALDRLSKYWVLHQFVLGQSLPLWPQVFHLTYVLNSGAAFSLFTGGGYWLRWLSLAVSVALACWAWFGPPFKRWEQWGFGLIFSGAFGNGIDRFATGKVVDFLDFRLIHFPIFNVADVCINLGLAVLVLGSFWQMRRPPRPGDRPRGPGRANSPSNCPEHHKS